MLLISHQTLGRWASTAASICSYRWGSLQDGVGSDGPIFIKHSSVPLKVQLCPAFFFLFLNKHSSSFLLCLLLPSWPHSIWDLSSPVRDRTCAPLRWKCRAGCWTTSEIPALYSCTETISRMYSSSAPGLSPPATHGLWAGSRFPHLPRGPHCSMLHLEDGELDTHLSHSSTRKLAQWCIHRCSAPELRAGGPGDAQTWLPARAAHHPLPAPVESPDPLEK